VLIEYSTEYSLTLKKRDQKERIYILYRKN